LKIGVNLPGSLGFYRGGRLQTDDPSSRAWRRSHKCAGCTGCK